MEIRNELPRVTYEEIKDRLKSLKHPYIFSNIEGEEQLYHIENIQIHTIFAGRFDDIDIYIPPETLIELSLIREPIRYGRDYLRSCYIKDIDTKENKDKSFDEIIKMSGLRIPTDEELSNILGI